MTELHQLETSAVCTLAAIVPLYNEQATVVELLTRLVGQPCISQVVLVDDGSTDGSVPLVKEWLSSLEPSVADNIHLLSHESNRGKGRAIRTGLERVTTSHVIVQDADLEYEPADINRLWMVAQSGEADVVYGSRYLENGKLQKGRWVLQSGVRLLNLFVRVLYDVRLTDEACCYKLFQADQLRSFALRSERFEFCSEVTANVGRRRLRVTEVAVSYQARTLNEGKKLCLYDAVAAVWELFRQKIQVPNPVAVWGVILLLVFTAMFAFRLQSQPMPLKSKSGSNSSRLLVASISLGEVRPGAKIARPFLFHNDTGQPWVVQGQSTTCGCIQLRTDLTRVEPGNNLTGVIEITVPSTSREFDIIGNISLTSREQLRLIVTGKSHALIDVTPGRVVLNNEGVGRFQCRLRERSAAIVVENKPSWCIAKFDHTEGGLVNGTITAAEGEFVSSPRSGYLVLAVVSGEERIRKLIPVSTATTRADLKVTPSLVHFGEVSCCKTVSKNLTVVLPHASDHEALTTSCADDRVNAELVSQTGRVVKLRIKVCGETKGYLASRIKIKTESALAYVPVVAKFLSAEETL